MALLYAQVGYPCLLLLAVRYLQTLRLSPQRSEGLAPIYPSVTVIIPAHNEEVVIVDKLQNVLQLDYPPQLLQILVVSDGSTDKTVALARRFASPQVEILDLQPNRGKASALNAGVKQARGDVLLLCDANVLFHPSALKKLLEPLSDPQVGAASGDVRLASEQSDFEQGERSYYSLERRIQWAESQIGSMMGVDGGMYVLRRSLYRELPQDTILDDFVTSMQVLQQGYRIVYVPEALAYENGTPTWWQEFRRRLRVTRGAVQSMLRRHWPPYRRPIECWQYLSHKLLRWLGPFFLLCLFITSALLASHHAFYASVYYGQVCFYLLAIMGWLFPKLREWKLCGVAFYYTMSHLAMLWGWLQSFAQKPTGRWERTPRMCRGS